MTSDYIHLSLGVTPSSPQLTSSSSSEMTAPTLSQIDPISSFDPSFDSADYSRWTLPSITAVIPPPTSLCMWRTTSDSQCGMIVHPDTVSGHFRDHHGIKNLGGRDVIVCHWLGCGIHLARHNFVRHIREVHLGHARGSSYSFGDSTLEPVMLQSIGQMFQA